MHVYIHTSEVAVCIRSAGLIAHLSGMGRHVVGQLRLFEGVCAILQDLHNAAVCAAASLACTHAKAEWAACYLAVSA